MKKALLVVTLLLLWASFAVGQRDGIPSFVAADAHDFDVINLTTLVPSLHIPVITKTQGPLPGSLYFESPQSCKVVSSGAMTSVWTCGSGSTNQGAFLWPIVDDMIGTFPVYTKNTNTCSSYAISGALGADGLSFYPLSLTLWWPGTCGATSGTATSVDGSGYTFTFNATGNGVTISSVQSKSGWTTNANGGLTDAFGNTTSYNTTSFTDSLGAVTTIGTSGGAPEYSYTDTTGTTQNITQTLGTSQTFVPLGGTNCSANGTNQSFSPVTSINYPDSTSISLGWQTNGSGLSGLINSITLRTGGAITYTYGTWNNYCNAWGYNTLSRVTPDGTTSYSVSYGSSTTTTTVLDPGKNKTVYVFFGLPTGNMFTQTITRYQNTGTVASPSYTEISSTTYCYNNASCSTAPTYQITQRDIYQYTYKPDTTQVQMSHEVETYDSTYGNLLTDAITDSINNQTITKTIVYGTWNGTSCVALGNTKVVDHPCTITTKNGTTQLAYETFTYNSNGAPTASTEWVSSTDTLTTNYTVNSSTGTMATKTLPNSQVITYTYGNCNSLLPTDITTTVNSVAIDNKMTWNCDAAVVVDTTDPNSNEDDTTYDSMNRISTYSDNLGNVTSYAYGTPTLDHVKVTDPLSVVSYVYNDGLGRPTNKQVCQTTGCSNLDTSSTAYAWNGTNFETTTYAPCTKTTLNAACTTVALTADTNPVFGPVKTTDANSGTLTWARNSKDFSVTAGPAPSQENTKVLQTEVDGFGRVNSTCALTSSGYDGRVSCGQTMGNSGTLTSSTFTYGTGSYEVDTTRGSQTHKVISDAVGRVTSTTTPEAGTTTGTYESIPANTCGSDNASNSSGDLVESVDAAGNKICYYYDGLHRLTDVGNSNQGTTNHCKRYRYDSTANQWGNTIPTGYPSTPYIKGRMFEAVTDNCSGTTITDEWFAYDKDGRMTDMLESTPDSSGYYHATVAYDADGAVTSLGGTGLTTFTFGVDGEDRPFNSQWGTTWIVGSSSTTGVSYDAASRPLTVPVVNSSNGDTYTWDNVGNMLTYSFASNSKTMTGTLTWNSIGSLQKNVITDGFNSGGAQTCTYGTSTVEGYDDVGRLLDANCGSLIQHDSWTYDQYDNASRTGNPGTSWSPGYSATTNEQTGSTYDSNGNVKTDGVNSYTWNVYGKMASVRSGNSAAVCGTSGTCVTYDAFGRPVENNTSGTFDELQYSPIGRIADMSGQNLSAALIRQPGGGAFYQANSTWYFLHPDWLGTMRLSTTTGSGTAYFDTAYTPYGEKYDAFGTLQPYDFTGDLQDIFPGNGLWDTPNRELFQNSSRWLSPDPAHAGWNAYAYPTDPNTQTDPSGLDPQEGHQNPLPAASCGLTDLACLFKAGANIKTKVEKLPALKNKHEDDSDSMGVTSGGHSIGVDRGIQSMTVNQHPFWNSIKGYLPSMLGGTCGAECDQPFEMGAAMAMSGGSTPGPGDEAWQIREELIGQHRDWTIGGNGNANQRAYAYMLPRLGEAVIDPAVSREAIDTVNAWSEFGSDLDLHNAIIEHGGDRLVNWFNAQGPEFKVYTTPATRFMYSQRGMYFWRESPLPPLQNTFRRFELRF